MQSSDTEEENPWLVWWMMIDSPTKTKRRFPFNRQAYRLSVLLASDIIKAACEEKMIKDLPTPQQKIAIRSLIKQTGMTFKQTEHFLKDFCSNWTLDVVPVFADQKEEDVSTYYNPIAAELFFLQGFK